MTDDRYAPDQTDVDRLVEDAPPAERVAELLRERGLLTADSREEAA